tara:strand:- start:394 stop:552 length:159 start_codon:yes stop_codon:yes gene_type:complete
MDKYTKFYKTFDRRFKNNDKLILCSKTLSDGGVVWNRELYEQFFKGIKRLKL